MKPVANRQAACEAVAAFPQGAGIDAIGDALPHIPRRTLQRLLGERVESGQLARIGKGRATLYMLVAVIESAPVADDYTSYIQLSDTSRALLAQLRRPLAARKPAAYGREWLEATRPTKSFIWVNTLVVCCAVSATPAERRVRSARMGGKYSIVC